MQYRTKKASYPKCPITGQRLAGIKALRPAKYSNKRMAKREKTVNRIYGGNLSHGVVRERIVRAFLLEERKIVKKVRTGPPVPTRELSIRLAWSAAHGVARLALPHGRRGTRVLGCAGTGCRAAAPPRLALVPASAMPGH